MAKTIKHSDAKAGEQVTTYNNRGGVGLGYLVDGTVYRTTGSYWAIEAAKDVFPMIRYERDAGQGYIDTFRNWGK